MCSARWPTARNFCARGVPDFRKFCKFFARFLRKICIISTLDSRVILRKSVRRLGRENKKILWFEFLYGPPNNTAFSLIFIANFPEFRRALRRKKCVYTVSVRCEKYRIIAAALGEVASLFRSEKVRAWRRHHATFAHKFRERVAKLLECRHALAAKKACTRPACAAKLSQRRCSS